LLGNAGGSGRVGQPLADRPADPVANCIA